MKNILTIVIFYFISFSAFSQVPQGINYQGSLRDNAGFTIAGKQIALRLSIIKDSANGVSEYRERHSVTTSNLGLFDVIIGTGTVLSGNFLLIDWGASKNFLRIEIDTANGNSFVFMGASQFLSVPYANFALKATVASIADSLRYGAIPVGTIISYAGRNIPNGWLLCDGSEVNRQTYDALFLQIDSVWGKGNGSSTFNLPDLRGQFLRGVNGLSNKDLDTTTRYALKPGGNIGNKIGSYQNDELKSHQHQLPIGSIGGGGPIVYFNPFGSGGVQPYFTPGNDILGKETRPKNAYVYFIIKCW
jgi:hypothetical protein